MDSWSMIEAERLAQADEAETYTDAEWAAPTPCDAWRVREVIAHMGQRFGFVEIPAAMIRARFDRDRFVANMAVAIAAEHDDDALVDQLRAQATSRWRPPGITAEELVLDCIVHAWDIRTSLDRPVRSRPDERYLHALDTAVGAGNIIRSRKRGKGLALSTSDVDWRHGDGLSVAGRAEYVLAALTGRAAALDELTGDGVPVLRQRCGT